jgi:putative oxidoreductase
MGRTQEMGIAILRVVVGIVFLAHGYQKLFDIGINGVTHMFHGVGIPQAHIAAIVVSLVEFLGGIALILGIGTRWAAALLAVNMAVAIAKVHLHNGLFSSKGGFEFPLTLLAACVAIALGGPGSFAVGGLSRRSSFRRLGR